MENKARAKEVLTEMANWIKENAPLESFIDHRYEYGYVFNSRYESKGYLCISRYEISLSYGYTRHYIVINNKGIKITDNDTLLNDVFGIIKHWDEIKTDVQRSVEDSKSDLESLRNFTI